MFEKKLPTAVDKHGTLVGVEDERGRTARWCRNLLLARRLWVERVKPEDVVPYLSEWTCGTQACFGGHLASWPEFQAMGLAHPVRFRPSLSVRLTGGTSVLEGANIVPRYLFGENWVFYPREPEEDEGESDYQVVLNRIDRTLSAHSTTLSDGAELVATYLGHEIHKLAEGVYRVGKPAASWRTYATAHECVTHVLVTEPLPPITTQEK